MGKKHPNVTHLSEVENRSMEKGTRFSFTSKRLGPATGAKAIGCSWFEVPPGKTTFPFHFHCANEESIFVLEGSGEMRIGLKTVAVEKGDYIAFPVGPEHAHSFKNTGSGPLQYLCMSTLNPVEVVVYPDSKKVGAVGMQDASKGFMSGPAPWIRQLTKEQEPVDYFLDEKTD